MGLANEWIFLGGALVALSIFAGLVSSRIGAPLLLVFLVLGMLAGESGPGGIEFDDFGSTYLVGSIALAVILFDGGLRTSRERLRLGLWPALPLATVAVVLTAVLVAVVARPLLGLDWIEALLIGSIVASTDAAAVFFLLHLRGMRLRDRVGATLEVESGLNDPMAVFLTVTCVELILAGVGTPGLESLETFLGHFAIQIAGGAVIGVLGGYLLLWIVNRLQLAPGLYPILAVSGALVIFGGAQLVEASGFLAAYLAGFVLGSHRHRATQLINRFHDGLAWLAQIVMFLLLGLLVTPETLLPTLIPALLIALFLMLVARPAAVFLCLAPFGFTLRERLFVSWVGLRGAVPIFLATVPVVAGLENGMVYFQVAYVVVLTSLVIQGWTVGLLARRLGLELPPLPATVPRVDVDLPGEVGREMSAYTVQPASVALRRTLERLPLPEGATVVSVMRDGALKSPQEIDRLAPGDYVLLVAPAEELETLDRIFGLRAARAALEAGSDLTFSIEGDAPAGQVAELYGFSVPRAEADRTIGDFVGRYLDRSPRPGARLRVGQVEIVVRRTEGERVTRVDVDLEPGRSFARRLDLVRVPLLRGWRALVAGARWALGRMRWRR